MACASLFFRNIPNISFFCLKISVFSFLINISVLEIFRKKGYKFLENYSHFKLEKKMKLFMIIILMVFITAICFSSNGNSLLIYL